MDQLLSLKYFARVVETHSFSLSARSFGVAPSSVTRAVDALEESLGVALLIRSTRMVRPTEAGQAYYHRSRRILADLEEASHEAAGLGSEPKGVLRVSAPFGIGQTRMASLMPEFLVKFPGIRIDIMLSDAFVDLIAESIDVAIRMGTPKDSLLKARKLENYRRALCASPAYLAARGTPRSPKDLSAHSCLTFNHGGGDRVWHFRRGARALDVAVSGPLHVNSLDAIHVAARKGLGIALLPLWMVERDLHSGKLVELLHPICCNVEPTFDEALYAVYAGSRPAPKVRAFIDFLVAAH